MIDIGLPPVATLLIALLVVAIVSDFLLQLYSVRVSQSTGLIQKWIFEQLGSSLFFDYVAAIFFQFISFRKKSFFLQLSSLVNVGSFNKKQVLILLLGSHIGIGLSLLLLVPGYITLGLGLCLLSLCLAVIKKDQLRDLGVGFFGLGLFLIILGLVDPFLEATTLNIHNIFVNQSAALAIVIFSTLFFRTPVTFLLSLAVFHLYLGVKLYWFPSLFLLHGLVSLLRFYWQLFQGRKRLHRLLLINFLLQLCQWLVTSLICYAFGSVFEGLMPVSTFVDAFQLVIVAYIIFNSLSLVLMSPLVFLISLLPYFNKSEEKKSGNQKIINFEQRDQSFSIHMSLFLLRQEFKKYTTSVHTIFKLARESDYLEEKVNQRFVRYQAILTRVGEELKELCFSIGRQRSYRWQVQEIMSYYKTVNQLELLVDDLAYVSSLLRKKDLDEDWEKECRYWLALQLKLFESFFHYTVGVGRDDADKVKANIEKSYDILDRFFAGQEPSGSLRNTSQTFYRITESIGTLAL